MSGIRIIRILAALISVATGASEVSLVVQSVNANSFPTRTIGLYIAFFLLTSAYARVTKYIRPTLNVPSWLPPTVTGLAALVVASAFIFAHIHDSGTGRVVRFGSPHAAIAFFYFLIGVVMIFGDEWMRGVPRWFKFGRGIGRS